MLGIWWPSISFLLANDSWAPHWQCEPIRVGAITAIVDWPLLCLGRLQKVINMPYGIEKTLDVYKNCTIIKKLLIWSWFWFKMKQDINSMKDKYSFSNDDTSTIKQLFNSLYPYIWQVKWKLWVKNRVVLKQVSIQKTRTEISLPTNWNLVSIPNKLHARHLLLQFDSYNQRKFFLIA